MECGEELSSPSAARPADAPSRFDLHAVPEGDVILDLLRRFLRLRVVPSGVIVHLAVDGDVIVARRSFPRADGVRVALCEIAAIDRLAWKVLVAFDHLAAGTLGQHGAVPDCPWHGASSCNESAMLRVARRSWKAVGAPSRVIVKGLVMSQVKR